MRNIKTVKRININHHYYFDIRINGVRNRLIRSKGGVTKQKLIKHTPIKVQQKQDFKAQSSELKRKFRSNSVNLSKKITKRSITLTQVKEIHTTRPLRGKKGVLQISFAFGKGKRKVLRTGRSNKRFYPREYTAGFNQCLQRAMAQIDFSPNAIAILNLKYVYWIETAK